MSDPTQNANNGQPTPTAPPSLASLSQLAIEKALHQDWKEAVRINTEILELDKENLDATNRLAYAYFKTGDVTRAKRFFQKVLKLDEYNQIATKNLKKLSSVKRKTGSTDQVNKVSPLMFLEEPGKTKIVPLVNLAPEKILVTLSAGQEVFLKPKRHCVEIRDSHGTYLGALPDDLSFKLIKFLGGGNEYHAVIKSIGKNQLIVFLREVKRSKRFTNQPSFVSSFNFLPLSHTESGESGPDTTPTGEESEEDGAPQENG